MEESINIDTNVQKVVQVNDLQENIEDDFEKQLEIVMQETSGQNDQMEQ